MTWLITAFEPFGNAKTNSSQLVLERLKQRDWQGRVEFFSPLPVTFSQVWPALQKEAEKRPHLTGILALGQAARRDRINLERVALNWIDASIPDNSGAQPVNCKIDPKGPELLWSNIPWEELEPSPHWERSYSAGTYLCNTLLYHLLQWCGKNEKKGGFIHLPLLESQTDETLKKHTSRMADDTAVESLSQIIRFLLTA